MHSSFFERTILTKIFRLEITRIALNEHKWIVYNKNCDRHLIFFPFTRKKATFR